MDLEACLESSRQAVEKYGLELLNSELSVDAWSLQVVILMFRQSGRCRRPEYRGVT